MTTAYDVAAIRADFPILAQDIRGQSLVYLDSAASAQKPRQVIDCVSGVYETGYANVHRGLHYLSEKATADYEGAREKIRAFMNAESSAEIIYTRGASEAINLVAASWGGANIGPGDEIVISEAEHHSNIVPWQILRDQKGAVLKVLPVDDEGAVHLDQFRGLLSERTKIVAVTHVSNVLGTVYPIKEMARLAHQVGAVILIDGCQGITHMPVDVRDLDCDFYAFSGHKLYGPSGIGVLYGKAALLEAMPPYQSGGDMIERVTFEKSTWAELPHKFEAGTPAIAQAIGLGAAVDYVSQVGMAAIAAHEQELLTYTTQRLASVPGLRLIGTAPGKVSVVSFVMDCAHPHDISTIIDQTGVAIRAGHHCAQPLIDRFDIPSAARASFGMYNTVEEADRLVAGLEKVKEIFAR
ncbi:MAG: cysteine desulfurase [Pseudomonadota bacterium]|nr:cysteine desulfurase [Pseudomonadota bacterium]MEC8028649.1 cysteine desulfurase [Pseudomonadota bacterium]MEC8280549.1 cysteine desulfurase [Pseudomonadota bacterium]MEC8388268.1 cysteine desulfurase [Pseudomonadota bacterium]MEC8562628.1 cysteine desulfurase [Pseudomonadota bacterium]